MFEKYEPHKSTIFNLDANVVVILMWIVSILCYDRSYGGTIVSLLIPFLILYFEKKSNLVRVHAGQVAVLMLSASLIQTLLNIVSSVMFALGGFFGVWMFPLTTIGIFLSVLSWIIISILVICAVFGCNNAFHWKEWRVPVLEEFGDILTRKIKSH